MAGQDEEILDEENQARVGKLLRDGHDHAARREYQRAIDCYDRALALFPPPLERWKAATGLLVVKADAQFRAGLYREVVYTLELAVHSDRALGNPYVHLRLGQALFEAGEERFAANWLAGAYLSMGRELFEGEDPKYLQYIESLLPPPEGFASWDDAYQAGWRGAANE